MDRVIPPQVGVDWYSIPFFSQGNPDYVVRVIGCADSEARYPPIAADDYLKYKFESVYKIDQQDSTSVL
jgi:isopenicillin N synthase-like dioxygenase